MSKKKHLLSPAMRQAVRLEYAEAQGEFAAAKAKRDASAMKKAAKKMDELKAQLDS